MTVPPRHYEFMDTIELKKNWSWFLALGILLVIIGLAAVGSATYTTLSTIFFLGLILAAGGIAEIIFAFTAIKWSGFFVSLLTGILYLVTGTLLLFRPVDSAVALTLLIGMLFVVSGFVKIIVPLFTRFADWGWVLLSGLVSLTLGFLVLSGWPETSLWMIGMFVGIDLFFHGLASIFFSLAIKNAKV